MWTEKVQEGKYTSPSGKSFTFLYEDVTKETDLKTATFTFPSKDGAHIQSNGRAGRRFPISLIFSGTDCFDEADACEAALEEKGVAELQHPVYGTRKVVPTGTIKRSDRLVSGANESIVEVVLAETIVDTDFPESTTAASDVVDEKMSAYEEAAASDFAENFSAENASESIKGTTIFKDQKRITTDALKKIAKKDPSAWEKYISIAKGLDASIDKVFTNALNVARQTLNLIKTPSRLLINAMAKLSGYSDLINQIKDQYANDPLGINNIRNQFAVSRLNAFTALACIASGTAISSTSDKTSRAANAQNDSDEADGVPGSRGAFATRENMLEIADALVELLAGMQEFQDSATSKNAFVDTGESYECLVAVVYSSVALITQASFSLPFRRTFVLGEDRQCLELVAELYGDLSKIDDFIQDNDLTADEIEIMPMGREVVHYVEVS
jgi:prophage DNA circulation protein